MGTRAPLALYSTPAYFSGLVYYNDIKVLLYRRRNSSDWPPDRRNYLLQNGDAGTAAT